MGKEVKGGTGIQTHVMGWGLALGLLLGLPAAGEATSYTFTKIAETSSDTSGFSFFGSASINDGGTVAFRFHERVFQEGVGSVTLKYIMMSTGTTPTPVADSSGSYSGFGDPSLNDGGQLAFQGFLDAGGSEILRSDDGTTLTSIADTGGPFSFLYAVSLNDSGQVAFHASLDAGGIGIFTGPDPIADKVIAVGDPLATSTVTQIINFGREGLNAAGQVAFIARLADGTEGVFRADPVIAGEQDVTQDVTIVITPGGNPNSINLRSRGTVAVAVLSTATFNATTVDPTTVTLAESPVKLKRNGTPMAGFEEVDGDGSLDLVVHVDTQALQLDATDTEAVLVGQTFDGTTITGTDVVRVLP